MAPRRVSRGGTSMRTLGISAGVVAILSLWWSGVVYGASQFPAPVREIVADLDGHPIKPELISSFYCHDFDYPRIHCSRSAADLKASETTMGLASQITPQFGVNDYVTIFDGPNYSGS